MRRSEPNTDLHELSRETTSSLRRRLLHWYDRHKRDLPWRRRVGDGYAQLLAEFMLQQTQVATVVDYYNRFIGRFPTVQDLADASEDEVLALWSRLGYYRRARNLHAAARKVVSDFAGQVPSDVDRLMTLPGVGRYTAGAIASVAYDTRAPVLDGNVTRVLMRLLALDADPQDRETLARLWATAEVMLPRTRCGDFNQALMELGATVCSPKGPRCLVCPLSSVCRARELGAAERIPRPRERAKVLPASIVVAAVRRGTELLFFQRPRDGLWAGLWELPSEALQNGEPLDAARRRLRTRLPEGVRLRTQCLGQVMRQLTHRRVTFHVYQGHARPDSSVNGSIHQTARWVTADELPTLGLSRACEAVLRLVNWPAPATDRE